MADGVLYSISMLSDHKAPRQQYMDNAVAMSHGLRVLICSTRCSTQVAAADYIEFSLPGNRVGLKSTGPLFVF